MPHREFPQRHLWGRAKGRALSPYQAGLFETLYPKIALGSSPKHQFGGYENLHMEIGFGAAEHLLYRAQANPDIGFIGVEPFLNGVAKALAGIDRLGLENVRLHHGDIWHVLPHLPDASLARVDILYPDPWPKTRHHKRRLINRALIKELARIMGPDAILFFASDIPSYIDWVLLRVLGHGGFSWQARKSTDWLTPNTAKLGHWPGTRFEARARKQGRTPHYFNFLRT